ncbi:glycoside hydrolase family 11 protein [Ruminococcus flavefaciens]|uniref:glycoside hydrolase family 11 protein n=1 Tax=Ruminococcus flavefaciens TaxID=1265 RepID=UPI0004665397|nr:glycoside hydrolase family 11 protein [Ruminococcus flavefaciens]
MRTHKKSILSALVSAAVLTASFPMQTAKADIVIDHDCSGVDKGYYYEIKNNDKDSQPEFLIDVLGGYSCNWDNDEDFMVQRGPKFTEPVNYTELKNYSCNFWKSVDIEKFKDEDEGYVRFGFRMKNTKGDTFTIMEYEDVASSKVLSTEDGYSEIGTCYAREALNYNSITDMTKKEWYTIYSKENEDNTKSVICSRKVPFSKGDYQNLCLSDILQAVADAGIDPGDLTGVNIFVEGAHSKGSARVFTSYYKGDTRPDKVWEDWEDPEAPIILKGGDYGIRTGYYYKLTQLRNGGYMEVLSPSLFKAEWDSTDMPYHYDGPTFGRGKSYDQGQSYKAVSGSSVDYTMNFDAEGSYFVETYARMVGPDLPEYELDTEVHIVDAINEWVKRDWDETIGEVTADGKKYEAHECSVTKIGTGSPQKTETYYFISEDAEENGKKGTVTVKHDLAPFMEFLHDHGAILGEPDCILVRLDGDVSKGTAELVKNEVTIPDFIPDDHEYDKEKRRIALGGINTETTVYGEDYRIVGSESTMKGFKGEKIDCDWQLIPSKSPGVDMDESPRRFYIGGERIQNSDGSIGYIEKDSLLIDYEIDMGEVTSTKKKPAWIIGGTIICGKIFDNVELTEDDYSSTTIVVADKWDGDPLNALGPLYSTHRDAEEFGVIESNGVKYDAVKILPKDKSKNSPYIVLMRQEQLEAVDAADVPEGYSRYAGTIDARDIVDKINDLGYRTFSIGSAYFSLTTVRNEGSATVGKAELRRVPSDDTVFTAEDVQKLSDFILGKDPYIPYLTSYDLNGDGVWDSFDLCAMRKRVEK